MSLLDQLKAANAAAGLAATNSTTPASPSGPAASPDAAPTTQTTPPTPQAPAQPCQCGFTTFWLDPYGNWHCQSCRPPKFAFQVRQSITLTTAGAVHSTADDEKRYSEFIDLRAPCGTRILARKGWDDPRSDYYNHRLCQIMSYGAERAEKLFDDQHRYLKKIFDETGSIDRLPGPWPVAKQENFSLASAENSAGEKNKKPSRKPAARGRNK